jgi:hypothetical protein
MRVKKSLPQCDWKPMSIMEQNECCGILFARTVGEAKVSENCHSSLQGLEEPHLDHTLVQLSWQLLRGLVEDTTTPTQWNSVAVCWHCSSFFLALPRPTS